MGMDGLLNVLETSTIAVFIQQSSWAFQAVETVHVLAFSLVVGTIAVVDLRLLDLASKNCAVTEVMRDSLRWTWIAFVIAAIAGFLMFITKATIYFNDFPFRLKMLLLVGAAINMLVFHFGVLRGVEKWDKGCPVPIRARIAGAISLTLWLAVIVLGRWVGFSVEESLPTL